MKKVATSLVLILGLIIPVATPANANDKCLAAFADSDWNNGTPAAVKSLLGFDLVEKITKNRNTFIINSYYVYGDHNESITYTYSGKNCTTRVIVTSKAINQQTLSFRFLTLNDYINQSARNFLMQESSSKYYAEIREILAQKSFTVPKEKNIKPNFQVVIFPIMKILEDARTKYESNVVSLDYPFIHFPNKCGYFLSLNAEDGIIRNEKTYAAPASSLGRLTVMMFETAGACVGELRQGGSYSLAEKIADIRYIVTEPAAPVAITCKKGNLTTKVKGSNSKCPKGYKKA
jgi:hypothetical protein